MKALALVFLLSGCTVLTGPTTGEMHSPAQPALVVCLLSSCNSTFNDKTARAGDDVANADKSGAVNQVADNTPVLTVLPRPQP